MVEAFTYPLIFIFEVRKNFERTINVLIRLSYEFKGKGVKSPYYTSVARNSRLDNKPQRPTVRSF